MGYDVIFTCSKMVQGLVNGQSYLETFVHMLARVNLDATRMWSFDHTPPAASIGVAGPQDYVIGTLPFELYSG